MLSRIKEAVREAVAPLSGAKQTVADADRRVDSAARGALGPVTADLDREFRKKNVLDGERSRANAQGKGCQYFVSDDSIDRETAEAAEAAEAASAASAKAAAIAADILAQENGLGCARFSGE